MSSHYTSGDFADGNILSTKTARYGFNQFDCDSDNSSESMLTLQLQSKPETVTMRAPKESNTLRDTRSKLQQLSARLKPNLKLRRQQLQSKKRIASFDEQLVESARYSEYAKALQSDSDDLGPHKQAYSDDLFLSRHPSYTIKNVDYALECEFMYMQAKKKYNAQIRREMNNFIAQKPRVADQYFARRLFSYATPWPPLHTKDELNFFINNFFQLPPRQKSRLNYLMTTDIF